MYVYFTYNSQGCVETHSKCSGIYNNHIIDKKFEQSSRDARKSVAFPVQ